MSGESARAACRHVDVAMRWPSGIPCARCGYRGCNGNDVCGECGERIYDDDDVLVATRAEQPAEESEGA